MSCCVISKKIVQSMYTHNHNDIITQLSPEGEVNSGGYVPRCVASRYNYV